ncbi:MAG: FAD-dependent oxidoreductase, partial [Candidatus Sumerlaeota bacterium]
MSPQKIVVIGGSAAGPKTASRARRLAPDAEITIVQKGKHLSMASCGYPYYVGDTFNNREDLISSGLGVPRSPEFFEKAKGIRALVGTEALSIDRENKTVACRNVDSGEETVLEYDKLILTTGATPLRPPIENLDAYGVTTLASMEDTDFLRQVCDEKKATKAVVIGGGLIGLESCEALKERGVDVTVVEFLPHVMSILDEELSFMVEQHLKQKDIEIITGNGAAAILKDDAGKVRGVRLNDGTEIDCNIVVVAAGFRPNGQLAKKAGLKLGASGGIIVDEYMATSDPDIYAAGDCVEIINLLTGERTPAFYGDLANIEGRVAAQNVTQGNKATFPGTWLTGIAKVFDFTVGTTGLSSKAAAGTFDIESVLYVGPDRPHFMGGGVLFMKMIADKKTRKILGVQCVGPGEVSRRVASAAMALHGGLTVEDLC